MATPANLHPDFCLAKLGEAIRSSLGSAKYFGILLALLAVGLVGHNSHWNFGFTNGTADAHQKMELLPSANADAAGTSDRWEVSFPSETSLHRSGVKTSPIKQGTLYKRVKTSGVITYDERIIASLSARVSGTVWRVLKNVGDPVCRGDVLVIIDAAQVGQAKAEFLKELVAVESKSEILATVESLPGVVSGRQLREARVAFREASIRLQNAEQNLVNLGLSVHSEAFKKLSDADRAARLCCFGLPEAIVKEIDPTLTTSNLLPLTASFEGVVIHQDVALGEMVAEGKPVVEIADLRRMWLKLNVPKEGASELTLGQKVHFVPDGSDRELVSEITWISTEMNQRTRTLQVRAEVDNPIVSSNEKTGHEVRMLRANTFGTGMITLGERTSAYVVPVSAVLHADNEPIVFLRVDDLSFARVNVKVGIRERDLIQIEADELSPEVEVVTQGSHVLKSEWMLNHAAAVTP